jgi:hypothetical protein
MPFELATDINDETKIPLNWLFAIASVAGGVLLVAAGLMVWGTRLEAKTEFQESRLSKVELATEQYSKNQGDILQQLVEIKVEMRHMVDKK